MYNQPEVALEKYELTASRIVKGRGAYICETDQGIKLLCPFRGSEERAVFLQDVMRYISENGMRSEEILSTTEGTVISQDNSETRYILKEYYEGTECNPRSEQDICGAVEQLARLHNILSEYPKEIPAFLDTDETAVMKDCQKHTRELVKVKNYIRGKGKKNEFERIFQKHYEHFYENAVSAEECLGNADINVIRSVLCHGDFNQHNVINTGGTWQIINLEGMNVGLSIMDITNFIRKMMEKNCWDIDLGDKMISSYDKVRNIGEEERRVLCYLLMYPEKFWKIANHYGNSNKAWLSGRDIEKLQGVIEQEPMRLAFLEKIFNFKF